MFFLTIDLITPPCFLTKILIFNSFCCPKYSANPYDHEAIPPLLEGRNSSVTIAISLIITPITNLVI
tara:strand:+ start:175 stop:375 length:201 start_codon:yes stop_codon:yes gene_type:complete